MLIKKAITTGLFSSTIIVKISTGIFLGITEVLLYYLGRRLGFTLPLLPRLAQSCGHRVLRKIKKSYGSEVYLYVLIQYPKYSNKS